MRDPKQYQEHGRNDPLDDEQRRQHPYDFVFLPDQPVNGVAGGHNRYADDRLTGLVTFVYETLSPLHVGSGVFETAAQCGLAGGDQPVRGIVRRQGKPVLPGSSWKGVVRARFEAITGSRLGVQTRPGKIDKVKLPEALRPFGGGGKVRVEITDSRLLRLKPADTRTRLEELSPADVLFGAMGYRGHLHPGDGEITGPSLPKPLSVPPMESPAAHRLAKPGAAQRTDDCVEISEVEGRKFYYDGPLLESRSTEGDDRRQSLEHVDAVPAGATITMEVHLESVTDAELGALLVSAGHGSEVGVMRFGGFKPAGLGKARLVEVRGALHRGVAIRGWHRPPPEPFDPDRVVATATGAGLIDPAALRELHEVTTRTRP